MTLQHIARTSRCQMGAMLQRQQLQNLPRQHLPRKHLPEALLGPLLASAVLNSLHPLQPSNDQLQRLCLDLQLSKQR